MKKTYYLKQGQSLGLKTIKISGDICEIYSLSGNTKPKKIEKIIKRLKRYEINSVVLSKKIHLLSNFVNILNSHEISIFDGKWIGQYLILDIIEYLEKKQKVANNIDEVAILANDLTEEVKGNINALVKKFKKVRIVTNHPEKFKKIENDLLENQGISIIISNNKKKSLLKSQIIINFDFVEEEINKYNINEDAIIISICEKIKINRKRFSGTVIIDYEIKQENTQNPEQKDLMLENEDFYKKEIYEEKIYNELIGRTHLSEANCSKYEIVRNIIKEKQIKVVAVYGENGKIS